MSIVDKVIAAVTPPETEEMRTEARRKATQAATPGDWLAQILDHHRELESAFDAVKAAPTAPERSDALKRLGVLLTGHSIAEEAVIYPALADSGEKAHAAMAYEEQSMAKVQLALLEKMDPMSQDFTDKLEHLEGAVKHHMYAEENNYFMDLKDEVPAGEQARMGKRYAEEYSRYVGTPAAVSNQTL